jgi:hypothetical protein
MHHHPWKGDLSPARGASARRVQRRGRGRVGGIERLDGQLGPVTSAAVPTTALMLNSDNSWPPRR